MSQAELAAWHLPRVEALQEGGVSLLALETMPASREAVAGLDCIHQAGLTPAWVSFTLTKEGR